jgi:ubiquitin-protein ligase
MCDCTYVDLSSIQNSQTTTAAATLTHTLSPTNSPALDASTASGIAAYEEQSSQRLKDFKLAIEFKYLMKCAPGGVYLMPEIDNIRNLHGAIFLRRGIYRDGIFRFTLTLPRQYNDVGTYPEITFTPPVFNPLIDPTTGRFDLRLDEALKESGWLPDKHFIMNAITFLKKIFYMKSYNGFTSIANPEAKRL